MSTPDYATPVDGIPAYAPPPRRGPSRRTVVVALAAAVVGGVLLGLVLAYGGGDGGGAEGTKDQPTVDIKPVSVKSFDPVGGSGFRDKGDGTWSTQTYTTAQFGGLKPGVGLLIDLGEARQVTTVTLPSATPGIALELVAGDEPPSKGIDGMTSADTVTTKDGDTSLSGADAGSHRYWMVWVTELARSSDGYAATVATPVVRGPQS